MDRRQHLLTVDPSVQVASRCRIGLLLNQSRNQLYHEVEMRRFRAWILLLVQDVAVQHSLVLKLLLAPHLSFTLDLI